MITGARNWITVPAPPVALGGVMSVARVIDVTDPHDLLGAEYQSDACAEPRAWEEFCTTQPCVEALRKLFDAGPELVTGDPFAVYAGVECDLARPADSLARAERRLAYTERRAVDTHVTAWLADDDNAMLIGPGPFPVCEGIGILEGYAAAYYGGVPTLIIERSKVACAVCAGASIERDLTGRLATVQGTPIANVAGDPVAPEPESWIYITGQITLLRGPVMSFVGPPDGVCDGPVSGGSRALAERIYVPLIECLAGKTQVTCS